MPISAASSSTFGKRSKASNKHETEKDSIWTLLAIAKAKGKGLPDEVPASAPLTPKRRPRVQSLESKPSSSSRQVLFVDGPNESASAPMSRHRRRATMGPPTETPPAKRRKVDGRAIPADERSDQVSTVVIGVPTLKRHSRRTIAGRSTDPSPGRVAPHDASPEETQSPSTPFRRIKLIVRKPPPSFSSPRQKPPDPKFGSSLESVLRSYTALEEEDLDSAALDGMVREDVAIWKQVDVLRRKGRMLHRPPDFSSSTRSNSQSLERSPDIWDHVIEDVKERVIGRRQSGRQVAAQIANRVKAYWEAQAVRDDKAKALEEKRLRALAKATIRLVTTKWRDAVYVSFSLLYLYPNLTVSNRPYSTSAIKSGRQGKQKSAAGVMSILTPSLTSPAKSSKHSKLT